MKKLFSRLLAILSRKKAGAAGSQAAADDGQRETGAPDKDNRTSQALKVEAYVLDRLLGADFEQLAEDKIPENSILRFYRGKWVHLVLRDRDGNITLPSLPAVEDGKSPNDLYDALYDEDSPQAFCKAENPWKGPVTKAMFGVIFAMLVFLWFIWSANMGD